MTDIMEEHEIKEIPRSKIDDFKFVNKEFLALMIQLDKPLNASYQDIVLNERTGVAYLVVEEVADAIGVNILTLTMRAGERFSGDVQIGDSMIILARFDYDR